MRHDMKAHRTRIRGKNGKAICVACMIEKLRKNNKQSEPNKGQGRLFWT